VWVAINAVFIVIGLFAVIFVFIHAVKHRREDFALILLYDEPESCAAE
jgi:hypothetical protein